jgi:integrase
VNKSVTLTQADNDDRRLRYCSVARSANGRIRTHYVIIDKREQYHPEGSYYLDWYDGDKRQRRSVGKNALRAEAEYRQQEQRPTAKAGLKILDEASQVKLTNAVTSPPAETQLTKKTKTLAAYTTALDYFRKSCRKQYVAEIERRDLLEFVAFVRDDKEQSPRSCFNKFTNVMSLLKVNGVRRLAGKNDWPRFTEEEPEVSEDNKLEKRFEACTEEERLWVEFFLMTGGREQEVIYTYQSDVNCDASVVRVTHKPDRGWTPKKYKGREIPMPEKLAERLKVWMAKSDRTCNLFFPNAGRKPRLYFFLDCLKVVAERATLDPQNFFTSSVQRLQPAACRPVSICARCNNRPLRHKKHHALVEAFTQSTSPGEGQRDIRVSWRFRLRSFPPSLLGYNSVPCQIPGRAPNQNENYRRKISLRSGRSISPIMDERFDAPERISVHCESKVRKTD